MYCIVRFFFDGTPEVMEIDLTLEEAQAHCQRDDTRGEGWFDGYDDMENRPAGVARYMIENGLIGEGNA